MKYSLKHKEFKKRNSIFSPSLISPTPNLDNQPFANPKQQKIEAISNQLWPIKQYDEDLRQSSNLNTEKQKSRSLSKQKRLEDVKRFINYNQTNTKGELNHKSSKHSISPNTKPIQSSAINILKSRFQAPSNLFIRSDIQKNISQRQSKNINIKYLQLTSNIYGLTIPNFKQNYKQRDDEIRRNTEQYLVQIYNLLIENEGRLVEIESNYRQKIKQYAQWQRQSEAKISQLYIWQNQIFTNEVRLKLQEFQSSLLDVENLSNKIEVFQNTMRSVYESLRIAKLKQQNLQMMIGSSSQRNIKATLTSNQNGTVENIQNKQLIQLLEYQSEISSVRSYKNYEFSDSNTIKQIPQYKQKNQKLAYLEAYRHNGMKKVIESQIFEIESNGQQYERLSPFQANHLMTNQIESNIKVSKGHQYQNSQSNHISPSLELKHPRINSDKTKIINQDRERSSISLHEDYSFRSPKQKQVEIKQLKMLYERKEGPLKCWRDEMGCLRRANMTYIFDQSGAVITLSAPTFRQLVQEGLISKIDPQVKLI